ncbi:MAG: type II toxin-antitoxin system VapC family toxin [Verrucomicrobia bacterium]|nr:type II toxin-antitoxin system VapC family toxin [Verrucomicrobiota bacterium]
MSEYWDTSCVLKLYTTETDSERALELMELSPKPIILSALVRAELVYVFLRKEGDGQIRPGGSGPLLERFEADEASGKFRLVALGSEVLKRAEQVGRTCLRGERGILLRTLDGLHLATAVLCGCKTIVTTDERMRAGAKKIGLKVVP